MEGNLSPRTPQVWQDLAFEGSRDPGARLRRGAARVVILGQTGRLNGVTDGLDTGSRSGAGE
jgi:hypothetical protein